jgi:hypothetical protein
MSADMSYKSLPGELRRAIEKLLRELKSVMRPCGEEGKWALLEGAVYSIGYDVERLASQLPWHLARELRYRFRGFSNAARRCDQVCNRPEVLLKVGTSWQMGSKTLFRQKKNAKNRNILRAGRAEQDLRKTAAPLIQWLADYEETRAAQVKADTKEQTPKRNQRPIKSPTDNQKKIATYYENSGKTQGQAAEACSKAMRTHITQKMVSLAVKAVNRWRKANPTLGLPQIQTRKKPVASVSMPSDQIELGRRTHTGQGMKTVGKKQAGQ